MITESEVANILKIEDRPEVEQKYIRNHARRLAQIVQTVGASVEAFETEDQVKVLDIGPHFLTLLLHHALGDQIILNTLGWEQHQLLSPGLVANHFDLDLNELEKEQPPKQLLGGHHLIVCAEVIEHLHIHPCYLLECLNNQLLPTGKLFLYTPNAVALVRRKLLLIGRHPYEQINRNPRNPNHFREYTLEELADAATEVGLHMTKGVYADYWPERGWSRALEKCFPSLQRGLHLEFTQSG